MKCMGLRGVQAVLIRPELIIFIRNPQVDDPRLVLHYGDATDSSNLIRII